MSKITFTEGLEVHYNQHYGIIGFVCEEYITICIKSFEQKMKNVCMLVYPDQYSSVKLAKESTK